MLLRLCTLVARCVISDFVSQSRCWQCRCPFSQNGLSDLKRLAPADYCMLAEEFAWPPTPDAQVQERMGHQSICHGTECHAMKALQQHADKQTGMRDGKLAQAKQLIKELDADTDDEEDDFDIGKPKPGTLVHAVLSEVLREATGLTAPQERASVFQTGLHPHFHSLCVPTPFH